MNLDTFLKHYGISENPFRAEEAKDDPVYQRIMDQDMAHPDFEKVFGSPDMPSTSVVFGEKGSGKTAFRLMIEKRLRKHNESNPDQQAWIANYDDLNAILDNLVRRGGKGKEVGEVLRDMRLSDHMDAILSLVTTRLMDFLLGETDDIDRARKRRRKLKRLPFQNRLDLAALAALYDNPKTGNRTLRWTKIRYALRIGQLFTGKVLAWTGLVLCVGAGLAALAGFLLKSQQLWCWTGGGAALALGLLSLIAAASSSRRTGKLSKQVWQEIKVIGHTAHDIKVRIGALPYSDLQALPLPVPGDEDSRYELTARMMQILNEIGFKSLFVLMDRVDEPAVVNGQPGKMRSIIWPMLNNKFLQQTGIAIKLLLPIELGYLLKREDEDFFLKARLDKQNMIDRLEWSGHTLYDICSLRLSSCAAKAGELKKLDELFSDDVTRHDITDALDQMKHPRDAFKFLYQVIQEHCQNVSDDTPEFKIPKSVLDQIRKKESQRVQDLYRGLARPNDQSTSGRSSRA